MLCMSSCGISELEIKSRIEMTKIFNKNFLCAIFKFKMNNQCFHGFDKNHIYNNWDFFHESKGDYNDISNHYLH